MKSIFLFIFIIESFFAWEEFQCLTFINNPNNCLNKGQARSIILQTHYFENPGQNHFSLVALPLSVIDDAESFVARLFLVASAYCNYSGTNGNNCNFICPTPIGYRGDGVTPLRSFYVTIEDDGAFYNIKDASPF